MCFPIQPAFDALLSIVDETYPVNLREVEEAKRIVLAGYGLSAREAVHAAVMNSVEIGRILSLDSAFDRFPGIERISREPCDARASRGSLDERR